ncbi:MAG TPA: gluconate 2-dehydrogenase subunit 3 family protein [Gemmatimonadaceae bacterium]|jgi:hypothetical protein|nr:gluconate 2-dehydrogenase subunit 3 family protein [Gemmatimonadaceae bacterium]
MPEPEVTTDGVEMSGVSGVISRREAVRRVSALLGGIAFVGGTSLLTACERERPAGAGSAAVGEFTADDIALLDEIAETILPETSTPGAKAAQTGAFMALMVTDTYKPEDQKVFRDGMRALDERSRQVHNVAFMQATPEQRTTLLETLDREAKEHMDARNAAREAAKRDTTTRRPPGTRVDTAATDTTKADTATAERFLPGQRQEASPGAEAGAATAITADTPTHYFRMMKELALLGYFTSEIGCKQAQRYVESPGRFDPCAPYAPGEKAWAPHA